MATQKVADGDSAFVNENPSPKRVLIVDDGPIFLEIMVRTLSTQGYEVGTAANGVEALRKFREEHWDLVITDLLMPTMSGEELALAIRNEAPDVPIILMSGWVDSALERASVYATIEKPFRGAELIALVAQALGG